MPDSAARVVLLASLCDVCSSSLIKLSLLVIKDIADSVEDSILSRRFSRVFSFNAYSCWRLHHEAVPVDGATIQRFLDLEHVDDSSPLDFLIATSIPFLNLDVLGSHVPRLPGACPVVVPTPQSVWWNDDLLQPSL